jgi:hypothetical protein
MRIKKRYRCDFDDDSSVVKREFVQQMISRWRACAILEQDLNNAGRMDFLKERIVEMKASTAAPVEIVTSRPEQPLPAD